MSNYDITFCEGENCSRKEECHRYRELLRFRADKDPKRKRLTSQCASLPIQLNALSFGGRKEIPMKKINGIIIDGKVYEVIKGICDKHCAFWNDKLCDNMLWYCTRKLCYFRFSPELTDKLNK